MISHCLHGTGKWTTWKNVIFTVAKVERGKLFPENEQWNLIRLNAAGVELLPNVLLLNRKKLGVGMEDKVEFAVKERPDKSPSSGKSGLTFISSGDKAGWPSQAREQ